MAKRLNPRVNIPLLAVVIATVALAWLSWPRQDGDPSFDARVAHPAYPGGGPRVVIDEAHWNVHTAEGRYKPFASLLASDGYRVTAGHDRFSRSNLQQADVLVIANALGAMGAAQQVLSFVHLERYLTLPVDAFEEDECAAVRAWVEDGGALLLVADHAPTGRAARSMAAKFSVEMTDWWAEDGKNHDLESDNWGTLVFSRQNGLLPDTPITQGRGPEERVSRVMTFTGQSLRAPPGATVLLRLSQTAIEFPGRNSEMKDARSAAGLCQGLSLKVGRGRVIVVGEAAALTSQTTRSRGVTYRMGMSRPDIDNRQLVLNMLHWLSGLLG